MINKLKHNKIAQLTIISVFGVILLIFLVYCSINSKNLSRSTANNAEHKMRYVLVNNDKGARYNHKNYNLGYDFLKLANRDPHHTWVSMSENEADKSIANGTSDVEVVIPEKFSEQILSLQQVDPKKVGIVYHVRKGQNEVTNVSVEKNVDSIVTYFNNRVVRMYFSSLVGKLRSAQVNAQTMANKQSNIIEDIDTKVKDPFGDLYDQFDNLIETSSILADKQDQGNLDSDKADFIDSIRQNIQALNNKKEKAENEDHAKQEQAAELNEKLKDQLEKLTSTANSSLDIDHFDQMTTSFNTLKDEYSDLSGLLKEIKAQRRGLKDLKTQLEKDYGLSVDNSIDQNTERIENVLSPIDTNTVQLLIQFNQKVASQIQTLPVYNNITKENVASSIWDENSKSQYLAAVKILQAFAASEGANYGSNNVAIANPQNDQKTVSLPVTLNLKEGKNTITFTGEKGVELKDISGLNFKSQEFDIKKSGAANNFVVTLSKKDKDSKTEYAAVTFDANYAYNSPTPATYSWKVNGENQNQGQLMSAKQLGDVSSVNANIKDTITAASEVASVYGNPQMSMTAYANTLGKDGLVKADNSLAKAVDPSSAVKKVPLEEKARSLASYYQKINQQLLVLTQFIGEKTEKTSDHKPLPHLKKLSDLLSADDISTYLKESSKILDWYLNAKKTLATLTTPVSETDVVQVKGTDTAVDSESLGKQAKEIDKALDDSTDTDSIFAEAKKGQNSAKPVVKDLTKRSEDLRKNTSSIMTNLKQGVNTGRKQADNNQNYARAFNNVMANARNGEADNSHVYNFLSNPIKAKGFYTATRQQAIAPYFMVLIGSLVALFIGVGISKYLPERKLNSENAMNRLNRFWFNMPRVTNILAIAILLGLIFGLVTMNNVAEAERVNWLFYTTITTAILIAAVAIGAQNFKNTTIFVYLILLGIFLLLTPFLGTLIRANSFIQMMYMFSPLQNLENGYTVIYNHSMIGTASIITLLVLLILVVVWGLFSKNKQLLETLNDGEMDEES